MNYNGFNTVNITGGYYDNTTGTLTLFDNTDFNLVGHVNVTDKDVSGTFIGSGLPYSFSMSYFGQY